MVSPVSFRALSLLSMCFYHLSSPPLKAMADNATGVSGVAIPLGLT